jgi:hypothetical protein
MRRLFLAGCGAAFAFMLGLRPAAAATVTDYTSLTNSTTVSWNRTAYTVGSGETLSWAGQTPAAANGGTSNGYYTAPANTASSATITWVSVETPAQTCTFNISTTYNSHFGLWHTSVIVSPSGGPTPAHQCTYTQPSDGPTSGFTLYYSLSN